MMVRKARQFVRALITHSLEFEFERMPYRLEGIPLSRLTTLVRSELYRGRFKPVRPWYPSQLQIETSSACTLRCPLCPSGMGAITDKPRGNMSMDTFTSLIDDMADYASIAVLWMWGEPFVNSRVFDMIAYAHSKNIATVASTNGQHVQSREDAERLVKSGLDNLVVALDGATQEVYSTYRVGGDIRKIMRCLELIRQAKDSLGSLSPRVNVRTVVMKHNEHELPDIEQIAVKYGADMVSKKTAFLPDYYKADADHDFAPSDPRYRRFKYQNDQRIRRSQHHFHCHRPWNRMSVTADGTVLPCEFDFNETAIFGKGGNSTSFADVWQSEAAAAFRKQFLRDRSVYKFCAECHFRDRSDSQCTAEMKYLR